jgi:hypothetical protein
MDYEFHRNKAINIQNFNGNISWRAVTWKIENEKKRKKRKKGS